VLSQWLFPQKRRYGSGGSLLERIFPETLHREGVGKERSRGVRLRGVRFRSERLRRARGLLRTELLRDGSGIPRDGPIPILNPESGPLL
jgi:hypothetical protein